MTITNPSPLCTVDGSPTLDGRDVSPSATVTIALADAAGVTTWRVICINTDELNSASTITLEIAASINPVTKTATFTAPASTSDGAALIFQSVVNNGFDINGTAQPSYTTTFGVYVLTANSLRVGAFAESTEGDSQFGWVSKYNPIIRAFTGGGGLAGAGLIFSGGAYNVGQNGDNTVIVNANDIQVNPSFYSKTNIADTLVQRGVSGAITVGAITASSLSATNLTVSNNATITNLTTTASSTLSNVVIDDAEITGSLLVDTDFQCDGNTRVSDLTNTGSYTVSSRSVTRIVNSTPFDSSGFWTEIGGGVWQSAALGANIKFPLDIPHGAVLNTVVVRVDPATGHTSAWPTGATQPLVNIKRYDSGSNLTLTLASQSDTVTGTAYDAAHSITVSSIAHTADRSTQRYFVEFIPESGANSKVNGVIDYISFTYTRTIVGED